MYSHAVLKRFVKDYSLPIQIVQEPYFMYFLNLYDKQYDIINKFNLLQEAIKQSGSEDNFLNEYYKIRDNIITSIEKLDKYKEYNTIKMDNYNVPNNSYPSHDIFNMSNVNKYFLSIDLKKANFQVLKLFYSELVFNSNTYQELIGKFTNLEYMKESKYLRQVIFGNMNPKRQIKLERFIIQKILDFILEKGFFKGNQIRMVSNDEIIFELEFSEDYDLWKADYIKLINSIKNDLNYEVDIEIYKLLNIEGSTKYFVKKFVNKTGYELMCIPIVYFAQIFKKYNDIQLEDNDLLFYYENQICKFINPLNFKSEDKSEK